MALPSDYVKVTLVLASPQKDHFYNVFYWKPDVAPSYTSNPMTDAVTVMNAAASQIGPRIPALLTTSCLLVGYNAELHKAGQAYDVSTVVNTSGLASGDELADFEAVVIQKRTAHPGKSGRGRWYFGPVPETYTDENYVNAATIPDYTNLATDWFGTFVALGVAWSAQLYSKKDASLYPITSTFVDPRLGSIGGRKRHTVL